MKLQELDQEVEELRKVIQQQLGKNPTPRLDESYSLSAEAKRKARQQRDAEKKKKKAKRKQKKKNARMTTADKVKFATRTEIVYPTGRSPEDCKYSHDRVAWRLENGKAVLIAYRIFRYRNEFGKLDGLVGRGEYGIEIMLALAYQEYIVGLSINKAC